MEEFCSLDFCRLAWYNIACNAVVFCAYGRYHPAILNSCKMGE